MTHRVIIAGTGMYVPERVVPNSYFAELYKNPSIEQFLVEKRNIRQRHFMAPEQATSDLIVPAVEEAMRSAGVSAADVDLLIVATDTPDYISPSTASVVQHRMGFRNAGCFDVNSACAGFVTALDMGAKYMQADDHYRTVVVVGAYGMTKHLNWEDYKITSLFADGAGAVVLRRAVPGQPGGILASKLHTEGQYHDYMGIYAGGTHMPVTMEAIDRKDHQLRFAKKIPLETNSEGWPRLIQILLDRVNRRKEDVKHFFLTQINIGTIEAAMDNLNLPRERSWNVMDRYGYTGSACIPMALADAVHRKALRKGDLLVLVGSGGGVAMASVALEWAYDT
ncbi:MAG: ketoacyl-ACP synthase III [Bdellovibrionales bacterium]|nr:ketoacyl-ACP synthase III [Bdellovibrionales bacterium]